MVLTKFTLRVMREPVFIQLDDPLKGYPVTGPIVEIILVSQNKFPRNVRCWIIV